jgi:TolB protein
MLPLLAALVLGADPAPDWARAESRYLTNIRQITRDFVRAGEGYFAPDGKTIIFQAEEKDTGNPFYQIFTMELASGKLTRVSPGIGKTTCSFFRPDGKKIIFASSHLDPDAKKHYAEEYRLREEDQKAGRHRRYRWDFDPACPFSRPTPTAGTSSASPTPGVTTPRGATRPTASTSSFARTAPARKTSNCT